MTREQFRTTLDTMATRLPAEIGKVIARAALRSEGAAKRNATSTVHARSGRLRSSIMAVVTTGPTDFTLTLSAGARQGANVRYAKIHEMGGTVRPIKAKYLAIPVGPAKTAAGVARYASPRDAPVELRFVQSLKGQPLLVEQRGKKGRVIVWYVLRRSVTIPARPYLQPALIEGTNPVPSELEAVTRRILGAA